MAAGRLAAIWPLVGILLEALLLCVIIVTHERKRARQRALSDTVDDDVDHKDTVGATNRLQVSLHCVTLHSMKSSVSSGSVVLKKFKMV